MSRRGDESIEEWCERTARECLTARRKFEQFSSGPGSAAGNDAAFERWEAARAEVVGAFEVWRDHLTGRHDSRVDSERPFSATSSADPELTAIALLTALEIQDGAALSQLRSDLLASHGVEPLIAGLLQLCQLLLHKMADGEDLDPLRMLQALAAAVVGRKNVSGEGSTVEGG